MYSKLIDYTNGKSDIKVHSLHTSNENAICALPILPHGRLDNYILTKHKKRYRYTYIKITALHVVNFLIKYVQREPHRPPWLCGPYQPS